MAASRNVRMETDEAHTLTFLTEGRSLRKVDQLWTRGRDREAVLAIDKEKRLVWFFPVIVYLTKYSRY